MNPEFGGLQTSPKLRLLPCSVVAAMRRVLLVEVGEVVHEVVEAIGECTNILIHPMKSVVNLPHALAELQKFIIGNIVVPMLLMWLIMPRVPGGSSLLLLLVPFPSSVVLLMLLFLFFFASLLGVWLMLSNYIPHLVMGEDPVVSSLK